MDRFSGLGQFAAMANRPRAQPPATPVNAPVRRRTFLREWRKFCGLSQESACERFAITQGTLSKIERGDLPYNQDFMEQAAVVYNCTVSALITINPLKADPLPKALSDLEGSPPEVRRQVANVIAAMLRPPS